MKLIFALLFAVTTTITAPDSSKTPGAVDKALTKEILCNKTYHTSTSRNVTTATKKKVCKAYGITSNCPGKGYEIDHLISIELGGSNDIENLWPQPVDTNSVIGYHTKDVLENRLHAAVCSGAITLEDAQKGISTNWYEFGISHGFLTK